MDVNYDIVLDVKSSATVDSGISVTQGDSKSILAIRAKLDGSYITDFSSVKITFKCADGITVSGATPTIAFGTIQYAFQGSELQCPGDLIVTVTLIYGDYQVSTQKFKMFVRYNPLYDVENASGFVSELQKYIDTADEKIAYMEKLIKTLQASLGSTGLSYANLEDDLTQTSAGIKALDAHQGTILNEKIVNITQNIMLQGKSFAFLGDSITIGQSGANPSTYYSDPWPSIFGNLSGATITNYAIGGATASMSSPATSNIGSQLKTLSASGKTYDYIVIMFGTNDYGYVQGYASVASGLKTAINSIHKDYQDTKIIGVIPPYMPTDLVENSIGYTALDYKGWCYGIYNSMNCFVIDFTAGLGFDSTNWVSHVGTWDQNLTKLHPNESTHALMGKYFYNCVNGNYVKPYINYSDLKSSSAILASNVTGSMTGYLDLDGSITYRINELTISATDLTANSDLLCTFTSTICKPSEDIYISVNYLSNSSLVGSGLLDIKPSGQVYFVGAIPSGVTNFTFYGYTNIPKMNLSVPFISCNV